MNRQKNIWNIGLKKLMESKVKNDKTETNKIESAELHRMEKERITYWEV